jgi:hypothetical protein
MGDAAKDMSERIDRLVAAQEAQTNALTRLLQVMQEAQAKKRSKAKRPVLAKPIETSPMVQAQVKRALARYGR